MDKVTIITGAATAAFSCLGLGIKAWFDYKKHKLTVEAEAEDDVDIKTIVSNAIKEFVEPRFAKLEQTISGQIRSCLECKTDTIAKNKLTKSDITNTINNTIYYLKEKFLFDLVFVLQPHPQSAATHLSVYYEAKREGVQSASMQVRKLPIKSVQKAYNKLCNGDFFVVKNVSNIEDSALRGIVYRMGGRNAICKKLVDSQGVITGFLIGVNAQAGIEGLDIVELEREFTDEAVTIQGIVPDLE